MYKDEYIMHRMEIKMFLWCLILSPNKTNILVTVKYIHVSKVMRVSDIGIRVLPDKWLDIIFRILWSHLLSWSNK